MAAMVDLKSRIQGFGSGQEPPPLPSFWDAIFGDEVSEAEQRFSNTMGFTNPPSTWYEDVLSTLSDLAIEFTGELSEAHPVEHWAPPTGRTASKDLDSPGSYRLIGKKASFLSSSCRLDGTILAKLQTGMELEVKEVVYNTQDNRVRGRLENPAGWISLRHLQTGYRWAERLESTPKAYGKAKWAYRKRTRCEAVKPTEQSPGHREQSSGEDDEISQENDEILEAEEHRSVDQPYEQQVSVMTQPTDTNSEESEETVHQHEIARGDAESTESLKIALEYDTELLDLSDPLPPDFLKTKLVELEQKKRDAAAREDYATAHNVKLLMEFLQLASPSHESGGISFAGEATSPPSSQDPSTSPTSRIVPASPPSTSSTPHVDPTLPGLSSPAFTSTACCPPLDSGLHVINEENDDEADWGEFVSGSAGVAFQPVFEAEPPQVWKGCPAPRGISIFDPLSDKNLG